VRSEEPALAVAAEKAPVRKRSLSIPAMLLLFFIAILVGGGVTFGLLQLGKEPGQPPRPVTLNVTPAATTGAGQVSPTPTTTDQLPTPSTYVNASSANVGLSFKYPSNWTLEPAQSTAQSNYLDLHPTTFSGFLLQIERFTPSGSTSFKSTGDVNTNNIEQIKSGSGLTNFQDVQPPSPQQKVAGVEWDEQDITFDNSDGVTFYFVTIAVNYKNLYYDIVYFAPQSVFSEAIQKYYQPMLSSLQFLT
jgi:hypothetical protein